MKLVLKNMNKMYYKGSLFNPQNKSYYGYKIDLLKSALQKYLRRKELSKMVWCMTELYLFKFADERAMGVISNTLNRVKIFLDEEMCFDDWERYLEVMRLIEMFDEKNREGLDILIKICKILIDCKMIRLSSDIKCYYNLMVDKKGLKICDSNYDEKKILKYMKKEDDKKCLELFGRFVDLFEKGSEDCCYYALKLLKMEEKEKIKVGKRFRRSGPSYMVWEYLMDKCNGKNEECKKVVEYRLREYHKKRGERPIFMTASIYMLLKYDEIDWNRVIDFNKYNCTSSELQNLLDNRKKLVIDDYCIDMHCSQGRKMGKNKRDFVLAGSIVVDEYSRYSRPEWRKLYIEAGLEHAELVEKGILPPKGRRMKKRIVEKKIEVEKKVEKKVEIKLEKLIEKKDPTTRAQQRSEKYKMIKKMRGKPNFDDLEKDLKFIDSNDINKEKIRLCTENTCGNKVMCFEYNGKIWKEGRKSMNYNRDYCVLDECKEHFGLKKIGMERILSNFRIEKVDKSKKSWVDNWQKVMIKDGDEKVVYCVMDKINPGIEIGKRKKEMLENRKMLKEFVKIGVFRGIFRVSDFNGRNVLIKGDDKLVSIDEGDIGKRLDIIGGREKWLINELNKDKSIIKEIIYELSTGSALYVVDKMKKYKFSDDLCKVVINNWNNLRNDLEKEGIEFE